MSIANALNELDTIQDLIYGYTEYSSWEEAFSYDEYHAVEDALWALTRRRQKLITFITSKLTSTSSPLSDEFAAILYNGGLAR